MKTPQVVSWCKLPAKSGRGYKWPTLNELHLRLFEEEFTGSHNAGADVEACARWYFELRKKGIIGSGDQQNRSVPDPALHRK